MHGSFLSLYLRVLVVIVNCGGDAEVEVEAEPLFSAYYYCSWEILLQQLRREQQLVRF